MFTVVTRRISLGDLKGTSMNTSSGGAVFPSAGLSFDGVRDNDYDVVLAEISAMLYSGTNQTAKSKILRLAVYNASSGRNSSLLVRVQNCVPITLKYANVSIDTPRATPVCAWYDVGSNSYLMNDTGVLMKKYRQKYREIDCALTHLTDFVVLEKLALSTHINLYILAAVVLSSGFVLAWALLATRLSIYDSVAVVKDKKMQPAEEKPSAPAIDDQKGMGEVPIDPFSSVDDKLRVGKKYKEEEIVPPTKNETPEKKIRVMIEDPIRKRLVSTYAAYTLLWEIYMVRLDPNKTMRIDRAYRVEGVLDSLAGVFTLCPWDLVRHEIQPPNGPRKHGLPLRHRNSPPLTVFL